MKNIAFESFGPPLSANQIASLEVQLGHQLPDDYCEFLKRQNGGIPEPGFFPWHRDDERRWVDWLCWVDENLAGPADESDVETLAFAQYQDGVAVPKDAMIIGYSCRDDLLLLFLAGERRGKIYIKYMQEQVFLERGERTNASDKGLYLTANSFAEFLDILEPTP